MYVKPNVFTPLGLMIRGDSAMGINQKLMTVAANQTIYPGDILVVSSGSVAQAITAAAPEGYTLSGGSLVPYYVALEGITTNASSVEAATGKTQISVAVLDANTRLCLRLLGVTGNGSTSNISSLGSASVTSALTVNGRYQFARYTPPTNTGSPFYALSLQATTGELVYSERYAGTSASDQFGAVWVRANAFQG